MNKIKNFFSKAENKANALVINAKTALQNKSGEGYIDTAVKIIIGVVIFTPRSKRWRRTNLKKKTVVSLPILPSRTSRTRL